MRRTLPSCMRRTVSSHVSRAGSRMMAGAFALARLLFVLLAAAILPLHSSPAFSQSASPGDTLVVCGNSNWGGIFQARMDALRAKLSNTAYFGPGGSYSTSSFSFVNIGTPTASSLSSNGCNIWISGYDNASAYSALSTFATNGGFVIGGCDTVGYDAVCTGMGYSVTNYSNVGGTYTSVSPINALTCDGGSPNPSLSLTTAGGASGYFSSGIVHARYNDSNAYRLIITNSSTSPYMVLTGDIDMFTTNNANVTAGSTISSDQDKFIANVFKLAADRVTGALAYNSQPSCQNISRYSDLSLNKSVNNASPTTGSSVTFTVTLTNNGDYSASGVQVTDQLPAGLAFVSATPSQGTYNSGTGVWNVGTVANGATRTLQIIATVTGSGTIVNSAEVTASNYIDPDSTPNDGTGDDFDSVSLNASTPPPAPTATQQCASLTGAWSGSSATSGGITVTRSLSASGGGTWNSSATDTMNTINAWSSTAVQGQPSLVDTFYWNDGPTASSGNQGTYTLTFSKPVTNPVIHIDRIGGVAGSGQSNSSQWTLTSGGTLYRLAGVGHFGTYADNSFIRTVGQSSSGGESSTNSASGTAAGSIMISGTHSSVQFSIAGVEPGSNGGGDAFEIVACAPQADLSLAKAVDNAAPTSGQDITFTLTLTNDGPEAAPGVQVTDLLPAGLTFVSATPSQGSYNSGSGVWNVGTVANGASPTLQIVATAGAAGSITNTAEVSASGYADPDSTPNDGSGDDYASVGITAVGVIAVDDDFSTSPINGISGGATPSVFDNDSFDGSPITPAMVTPTLTSNGGLTGATLNPDGTITVPGGSTDGNYTLTYQICRVAAPADCDTATVLVTVSTTPPVGTGSCTGTDLASNGGFETPLVSGNFQIFPSGSVPGWTTTDTGIEIWTSGFNGVPAHTGNQFNEMNAQNHGTLTQGVSVVQPHAELRVFWAHRGRVGTDTASLAISDNGGGSTNYGLFSTSAAGWTVRSTTHVASASASSASLAFTTVSTSGGSSTSGNFLDSVEVCQTYIQLNKSESSRSDVDGSGSDTAGDTITYDFSISNPAGNESAVGLTSIIDDKIGTISVGPPLSGDTNTNGFLDPGETWVVQADYTLTQSDIDAGSVTNTAYVQGNTGSNTIRSGDAQYTATLTAVPALTVTKSADADTDVTVGQVITYTYTITNTGNQTISAIKLADAHGGSGAAPAPDPDAATLTDNAPTGDSNNGTTGDGEWDALAPGDVLTVTATYTVTQNDVDTLQ